MNAQIYLEIQDPESLILLLVQARNKIGLLKDVPPESIRKCIDRKVFPLRIPVNVDGILDLAGNPILKKMFGKKLETSTRQFLLSKT